MIPRQVRGCEPVLGNLLLGYCNLQEMTEKHRAAFVDDNFVIMGLIAAFRHLIADTSSLSTAPLDSPFCTCVTLTQYPNPCFLWWR